MPTIQTSAFNGENCKQILFSGYDFDGYRQNDVFIINGDQVTATQQIFLVDAKNKTLPYAGNLPVNHEYQSDGTYLYKEMSPYVKSKTIYVFSDKKLVIKKTTSLVFDGDVCLDNSDINISCERGQKATREQPVCYVRDNNEDYHILPLTKCDIKKKKFLICINNIFSIFSQRIDDNNLRGVYREQVDEYFSVIVIFCKFCSRRKQGLERNM